MFLKSELIADLAGFFQLSENEAEKIMDEAFKYYADEWRKEPRDTKESSTSFYETSTFNSFDLAHWHQNDREDMSTYEQACNEGVIFIDSLQRYCKVLDYGAGIGSLCIRLAQKGHEVHHYDIGLITREFAKYRCKHYDVNVIFHESVDTFPENYFNVAYCYDTIEHLDEDEIRSMLTSIYKALAPDGRLFTSVQFPPTVKECEAKPSHLPEHIGKEPTAIFPVIQEVGFILTDPLSYSHFIKV